MNGLTKFNLSILGFFLVFAAVLLPDIKLANSMPRLQTIDFLLPLIAVIVWINRKELPPIYFSLIPLAFSLYILVSIFITKNHEDLNPYFEIYKMLKIALLIGFFSLINFKEIKNIIHLLFGTLVLVNLLHFFDLFNVNYYLENYYHGGIHIKYFGLDSLGNPAVKRLAGTMGNPNINGLLFGAFAIFYFPFNFKQNELILFFVALLMAFLCQSRTLLVVILVLLLFTLIFHHGKFKGTQWIIILIGTSFVYFISWMLATSFFQYPSYNNSLLDGTALMSGSVRSRWESWKLLSDMIVKHPIFGFGPNKNFFYANHIYSENEYLLMTWRYGIVGLLFYLSIFIYPLLKFWGKAKPYAIRGIFLVLLMTISAITNNPLTEKNIVLIYIFGISWSLKNHLIKETHAKA
jgi:O-antigen ligase